MFWTNFTLYAAEFKSNSFLERFSLFLLSDWCFPDSSSIWYFTSVCFCKPRQMCEQGFWSRLTFFLDEIVSHDEKGFVGVFRMKIVFSKYQLERIQERCSTMGRSFTDGWNFRLFSNWTLLNKVQVAFSFSLFPDRWRCNVRDCVGQDINQQRLQSHSHSLHHLHHLQHTASHCTVQLHSDEPAHAAITMIHWTALKILRWTVKLHCLHCAARTMYIALWCNAKNHSSICTQKSISLLQMPNILTLHQIFHPTPFLAASPRIYHRWA